MSSETHLDGVQQQIADVGRAVSNLEASLAERAGDDRKVEFLRDRLKTLDKKEVALREEKIFCCELNKMVGIALYCQRSPHSYLCA